MAWPATGLAEQFDQRLAFRSFAAAAGEPAGTIERTRQSGSHRLRHRIDDVFRLEFWKIGELVPDLAIKMAFHATQTASPASTRAWWARTAGGRSPQDSGKGSVIADASPTATANMRGVALAM